MWAVRFVLAALKTGFHEVRFHFSGDPYDPFVMRGTELLPRPLESAMVALNQWMPIGSSIRTVPGIRGLQASALGGPTGAVTLILDNEQRTTQAVLLKGVPTVDVQEFGPARTGLVTVPLKASHATFKLIIPANAVAVVTPGA